MAAAERRKGANGELEVVRLLRAHGWTAAKRTSDGRAQVERGDIADGPPGIHWEVRRRERAEIWSWAAQAEREARPDETPVVAFRRSRVGWRAALPLNALLALLKEVDWLRDQLHDANLALAKNVAALRRPAAAARLPGMETTPSPAGPPDQPAPGPVTPGDDPGDDNGDDKDRS